MCVWVCINNISNNNAHCWHFVNGIVNYEFVLFRSLCDSKNKNKLQRRTVPLKLLERFSPVELWLVKRYVCGQLINKHMYIHKYICMHVDGKVRGNCQFSLSGRIYKSSIVMQSMSVKVTQFLRGSFLARQQFCLVHRSNVC